jgi:hypothetical protein
MGMKLLTIISICMVLLIGGIFAYNHIVQKENKIDCSKPFDVIYLKPSEIKYASNLANKINGVIVIPELNQIIARTEILSCKEFDVDNYLNLGVEDGNI